MAGTKPGELIDLFAIIPENAVVGGNPKVTVQAYVLEAFAAQLGAKLVCSPVIRIQKHVVGETHYQEQKMVGGRCGAERCYANVHFSYDIGGILTRVRPLMSCPLGMAVEAPM